MKERPIIFSGPMVEAILGGRKTMTRRVVKPQPRQFSGRAGGRWIGDPITEMGKLIPCPYGQPGQRLWVRETFAFSTDDELLPRENHRKCPERAGYYAQNVVWRADGNNEFHPRDGKALWKPSIHMPRWASRLLLEVVAIRVERVGDTSSGDAFAEGILEYETACYHWEPFKMGQTYFPDAVTAYRTLWDSINRERGFGWDSNPWVWVVEFKIIEAKS